MGAKVLFIVLLCALLGQAYWNADALKAARSPRAAVEVTPVDGGISYHLAGSGAAHLQEYLLRSTVSEPCMARIINPSCGCLGFLVNGEGVPVGQQ